MNLQLQKFIESGATLNVVADENMPGVEEYFSSKGLSGLKVNIKRSHGREINAEDIHEAHVLLVRSVTKVNKALIENCRNLFFVGSATIGVNHVDQEYLKEQGIQFEFAPGCNAQGVAEYVMSAIALLRPNIFSENMRVGIVGFGNTGSRVAAVLQHLGIDVLVCDPFKQASSNAVTFSSFEDVLKSDIVSFHVPLTVDDAHPTSQMLNEKTLKYLKADSLLINTSRGEVFDQAQVYDHFSNNKNAKANLVLDVWENEPSIDLNMVKLTSIATSHIAGYSWEGKWRGTLQLYQKLSELLDLDMQMSESDFPKLINKVKLDDDKPWHQIFNASYDLLADDQSLRKYLELNKNVDEKLSIGEYFDSLRKHYAQRCEWSNVIIEHSEGVQISARNFILSKHT